MGARDLDQEAPDFFDMAAEHCVVVEVQMLDLLLLRLNLVDFAHGYPSKRCQPGLRLSPGLSYSHQLREASRLAGLEPATVAPVGFEPTTFGL